MTRKDAEDRLAQELCRLVKSEDRAHAAEQRAAQPDKMLSSYEWQGWDEDFGALFVDRCPGYVELTYRDSGVGEDYVQNALVRRWPRLRVESEVEGGCDSCGYGRRVTLTLYGSRELPWELCGHSLREDELRKLVGTEFYVELKVLFAQVGRLFALAAGVV